MLSCYVWPIAQFVHGPMLVEDNTASIDSQHHQKVSEIIRTKLSGGTLRIRSAADYLYVR